MFLHYKIIYIQKKSPESLSHIKSSKEVLYNNVSLDDYNASLCD